MEKYLNMGYDITAGEDLFSTATGLADDFDAIVVDAHFAPDAQYHSGLVTLLHLTLLSDDPDVGEQKVMYSCGSGWNSLDGGKTVVHDKKRVRFMKTSIYGRIIDRLVDDLGMGDLLRARGYAPFDAGMWIGFKAHWNREEIQFKGSGAPDATSRLFPTKFLGYADQAEIDKALSGIIDLSSDAATEPSASKEAASDSILATLTTVAQSAKTQEDFVKAALAIPNVSESSYFTQIIDQKSGLYEKLTANN